MQPYTLIRSNRKTIAIHITKEATVEVRAPLKMAKGDIDGFVTEKSSWIDAHLTAMTERVAQREDFALTYGDTALYRGNPCPIVEREGKRIGFDDTAQTFYIPPDWESHQIQAALVAVYKLLAKRDIPQKVAHFASQMGLKPKGVKVNSAKTRWGSCSSGGSLNFSWRLIMASDAVIDYVVIHELSHMREMNHAPKFWAVVGQYCPDYQRRREDLKELQHILAVQDWD